MSLHPHWQSLLAWLATHGADTSQEAIPVQAKARPGAGYGLFTLKALEPQTRLFSIPASALLNRLTLSPLYPGAQLRLTATQLISLHLSHNRPVGDQGSPDPAFGAYISTLPREFEAHPLTWLINKDEDIVAELLLPVLPPSVMHGLHQLADRFDEDWKAVQRYTRKTRAAGSKMTSARPNPTSGKKHDYLWAWLSVNTRCLYYRSELSPSDKNNITLCPILDFANHTVTIRRMLPLFNEIEALKRLSGTGDFAISSPSSEINSGDELYLNYGSHSNRTLFMEYGFVNEISREVLSTGRVQGEIDIQRDVESLFKARGELGVWMRETLTGQGYWGDWTLHLTPLPAHPSFRVIVALRLYHIFPESLRVAPLNAEAVLQPWIATLLGTADKISQENEYAWRNTLFHLCNRLSLMALSAIDSLENLPGLEQVSWYPWMKRNIKMLWEEEVYVADAVAESVSSGEEF